MGFKQNTHDSLQRLLIYRLQKRPFKPKSPTARLLDVVVVALLIILPVTLKSLDVGWMLWTALCVLWCKRFVLRPAFIAKLAHLYGRDSRHQGCLIHPGLLCLTYISRACVGVPSYEYEPKYGREFWASSRSRTVEEILEGLFFSG